MPYQGLGAREMVRVRLKAVILGVEECHPPREARGISVQVILMRLPQAAVRDPRVGDRDVRGLVTAMLDSSRVRRISALRIDGALFGYCAR